MWRAQCQQAFHELRQALISAPILSYPQAGAPYILDTDASKVGLGGVLSQVQAGEERVLAYCSRTLRPSQRRYCTTKRAMLRCCGEHVHAFPVLPEGSTIFVENRSCIPKVGTPGWTQTWQCGLDADMAMQMVYLVSVNNVKEMNALSNIWMSWTVSHFLILCRSLHPEKILISYHTRLGRIG